MVFKPFTFLGVLALLSAGGIGGYYGISAIDSSKKKAKTVVAAEKEKTKGKDSTGTEGTDEGTPT